MHFSSDSSSFKNNVMSSAYRLTLTSTPFISIPFTSRHRLILLANISIAKMNSIPLIGEPWSVPRTHGNHSDMKPSLITLSWEPWYRVFIQSQKLLRRLKACKAYNINYLSTVSNAFRKSTVSNMPFLFSSLQYAMTSVFRSDTSLRVSPMERPLTNAVWSICYGLIENFDFEGENFEKEKKNVENFENFWEFSKFWKSEIAVL